jgi:hypothetical protein
MMFENLVMLATDILPHKVKADLLPYDFGGLVRYAPLLIADRTVALYTTDVEDLLDDVYEAFTSEASARVRDWPNEGERRPGQSDQEPIQWVNLRRAFQPSGVTYQLLLLPTWLGRIQHVDGNRLAIVNGQTGKVAFPRS